ncbi:MAG: hypothetical protein CMN72_00310 [Sphingomonas sp.]|nr:hypothetical protein [Sphingomonas sp.]
MAEPLDLILEKEHQIKGAKSIEWVEKHSLPIEELYSHCKFRHFMIYSLIESNQSLPLFQKESYSHNESEEDYEYDKELFKYLKDGIISDKLKQIIDERLKVCRKARERGYWNFKNSSPRYDKAQMLHKFKDEVVAQCSPVVWHVYSSLLVFRNDASISDKNFGEKELKKICDTLSDYAGDIYIGDVFQSLEEVSNQYCDDDAYEFVYKGGLKLINDKTFALAGSVHPILYSHLGRHYNTEEGKFDAYIPRALVFSEEASILLDNANRDGGGIKYITPEFLFGHEEYDFGRNALCFAVIPVIGVGKRLSKRHLLKIQEALLYKLRKDIDNESVIGLTGFHPQYNAKRILFQASKGVFQYDIGRILGDYLKRNNKYAFELLLPSESSYLRITENGVYRPLGFDHDLLNHISDMTCSPISFSCYDIFEESLSADLVRGVAKALAINNKVLSCYQDNLIKQEHFTTGKFEDSNGELVSFSEYDTDLSLAPACFELFPKCFFYTQGYEDFVGRMPFSSCHNVYIIFYDNDESAFLGFYIVGYNKSKECIINVVYYDDEMIMMNNANAIKNREAMIKKIKAQISGDIIEHEVGDFSISDDNISHSLLHADREDVFISGDVFRR